MLQRLLFLTVLILNVLLFAWGSQRKLPELAKPNLPAIEGPSILLASDPTPTETATTHVAPNIAADNVPTCIRLGPIDQQAVALELTVILERGGHKTAMETETTQQHSGFWIVIATKAEKADALMAELNGAGILDIWRFDKGPLAGMLSLGLYSERTKAEKRRNFLVKKGFKAEIRPRDIEVPNYWIHTRYNANDQAAKKSIEQVYERYPTLKFPPPTCSVNQ